MALLLGLLRGDGCQWVSHRRKEGKICPEKAAPSQLGATSALRALHSAAGTDKSLFPEVLPYCLFQLFFFSQCLPLEQHPDSIPLSLS